MRTIVHLSDPHFGRLENDTVQALISAVAAAEPSIVVVSGDLTQRARKREFEEAREFLDALPSPQIVVPGNHDVPLYNVYARARQPFTKYRHYIGDDLEPFYCDEEIAVLGINTARSFTLKNGRINREQVARSCARLQECGAKVTKVVVTHHPFDSPQKIGATGLVGRARLAMAGFAASGVDLILSGHLHVSHTAPSETRYKIQGHSALLIQAGTATSTRGRGEPNSFNIIQIDRPRISVRCMQWNREQGSFLAAVTSDFQQSQQGWSQVPDAKPAARVN